MYRQRVCYLAIREKMHNTVEALQHVKSAGERVNITKDESMRREIVNR